MKTQICILSALLGLAAVAAGEVNVLSFGATADGKTDCTAAFQRAIDALKPQGGKVTVPAGVYVTGELQLWPGVVVEGAGGFAFRGLPKGSTLKLRKGADARAMFNLTGAMGATLRDLALLGDVDGLPDSGSSTPRTARKRAIRSSTTASSAAFRGTASTCTRASAGTCATA